MTAGAWGQQSWLLGPFFYLACQLFWKLWHVNKKMNNPKNWMIRQNELQHIGHPGSDSLLNEQRKETNESFKWTKEKEFIQHSSLYLAHLQVILQQQTYCNEGMSLLCINAMTEHGWCSLADLCLDSAGHTRVADAEQATGRGAWREPVAAGQSFHQGLKVYLQVYRWVLLRDLAQWLHSFISNYRLLHSGQALQRWLGKSKWCAELSRHTDRKEAILFLFTHTSFQKKF